MRKIESAKELAEWASSSKGDIAGVVVGDIVLSHHITIPSGKLLRVEPGSTIDLGNQRDILVIDCPVDIPEVPVFKNALPLVDGRGDEDPAYPSIWGEWGGSIKQAIWWNIGSEGEDGADTNLRALQCAVDSGRFLDAYWPCQYQHEVRFTGFRWSIKEPLDLAGRRVTLSGAGRDSSHIEYSGDVGIVFTRHEFNEGGRYQVRVRDFSLRPVGDDSLAAIAAFGTCDEQTVIERISVFSVGRHGILIDGGQNGLVIRECTISGRVIGGHEDASGISFTHTQPGGQWSIGVVENCTVNVGGAYSAVYVGPDTTGCELALRDIHTEHSAIRIEATKGFVKIDNCNAGNVTRSKPVIEINSGGADGRGVNVMVRGYSGNGATYRARLIDHQAGVDQQIYDRTIMKYDRGPAADGSISYELQRDGL